MNRILCIGIAVLIALVAGSIENAAIVFAGASILTLIAWFFIIRFVPRGHKL